MANKYMGNTALAALIGKIRSAIADAAAKIKDEGVGRTYESSTGGEIFNDYSNNVASGKYSHAEGNYTTAKGPSAHTEGYRTETGDGTQYGGSHAEGHESKAIGLCSHAEGRQCEANGDYCHVEGILSVANGICCHAEGQDCKANNKYSHAEGFNTTASGEYSHVEGRDSTASGNYSHAECHATKASGAYSHAEGELSIAQCSSGHAEGYHTQTGTDVTYGGSHAEGRETKATGIASHAEGQSCVASGACAHAEGTSTEAKGSSAHAGGQKTIAHDYQTAIGQYNVEKTTGTDGYLIVGAGSVDARKNVFRVSSTEVFSAGPVNTSGADYAELFEFCDGNPDGEDRVGRFVTLDGMKIRLSKSGDEPLGVLSGTAAILGDVYDDQWHGMEQRDVYGRLILQMQTVPAVTDEEGSEIVPAHEALLPVRNPEYDNTQEYIPRTQRPEWAAVGMLGKLVALDDGTCEAGGYCQPSDGGVATRADDKTRYYVMERIDPTHIRVLVRP